MTLTDAGLRMRWRARKPGRITFSYPTMTGTVLAIAAAAACDGRSTISGASVEPSCDDQIDCLRRMGASVDHQPGEITIDGAGTYESVDWSVPHDRIHAVTYITAGLLVRGEVT